MKRARWSINSPLSAALVHRGDERHLLYVRDKNGQGLGYFYYEEEPGRRMAASLLTKDEARRLAANFAKPPELLEKQS
jgi:hypothetical protein